MSKKEVFMNYYWIRKEDLEGQKVIDEVDIEDRVVFVKVGDIKGAGFYHKEVSCPVHKEKLQTA